MGASQGQLEEFVYCASGRKTPLQMWMRWEKRSWPLCLINSISLCVRWAHYSLASVTTARETLLHWLSLEHNTFTTNMNTELLIAQKKTHLCGFISGGFNWLQHKVTACKAHISVGDITVTSPDTGVYVLGLFVLNFGISFNFLHTAQQMIFNLSILKNSPCVNFLNVI